MAIRKTVNKSGAAAVGQQGARVVLAAPDKFRGTLSARQVAQAIATGASRCGWQAVQLPLADGGEGTLEALGGPNRTSVVTGPLGEPVAARWRLDGPRAVIEMAAASGLALAGGKERNDPLRATTRGTGELIAEAVEHGAYEIVVTAGGSATTDGGWGACEALGGRTFSELGVSVEVACDVRTLFVDAARIFAPQKGAGPAVVTLLSKRLEDLADSYRSLYGVDICSLEGSGAAGGLAGGLAALGAAIVPGFDLVASAIGLDGAIDGCRAVVTGEGGLDETSFDGKVVGALHQMVKKRGSALMAVVGSSALQHGPGLSFVSLTEVYGEAAARNAPEALIAEVTASWLSGLAAAT